MGLVTSRLSSPTTPTPRDSNTSIQGSGTYYGPHFIFNNNGTAVGGQNAAYFDEVMNLLSRAGEFGQVMSHAQVIKIYQASSSGAKVN